MKPSRAVASTVIAVLLGVGLALVAAPAGADVPKGWSDPPAVDKLHALLLLAGIPIGLALVISLLTLAPGLARGEGLISSPSDEPDWLGGPTHGVEALPAGRSEESESDTGGSSGRW